MTTITATRPKSTHSTRASRRPGPADPWLAGPDHGPSPAFSTPMSNCAIISVGGKQCRVQEGDKLLVDRVKTDEGKTFHPDLLFVGGDGKADFKPRIQVTAKVLGHVKGEKIRIGKYRRRTGYRRHTGHRSSLSPVEITAIGAERWRPA